MHYAILNQWSKLLANCLLFSAFSDIVTNSLDNHCMVAYKIIFKHEALGYQIRLYKRLFVLSISFKKGKRAVFLAADHLGIKNKCMYLWGKLLSVFGGIK